MGVSVESLLNGYEDVRVMPDLYAQMDDLHVHNVKLLHQGVTKYKSGFTSVVLHQLCYATKTCLISRPRCESDLLYIKRYWDFVGEYSFYSLNTLLTNLQLPGNDYGKM